MAADQQERRPSLASAPEADLAPRPREPFSHVPKSPEMARMARMVERSMMLVYGVLGLLTLLVPLRLDWRRLLLIPALVAAVYFGYHSTRPIPRAVTAAACVVSAATAIGFSLFDISPFGAFGLSICGSLTVARLTRHRWAWAVALLVFSIGCAALVWFTDPGMTGTYVLVAAIFTGANVYSLMQSERSWRLSLEVEAHQRSEKDLAVARERFRFAADLHDIHGHTLHVVKLKAALAERLVRTDPARAEEELREIRRLIAVTIRQTREIAAAERRLTLAGELANAENLLQAAGARVTVRREGEVPADLDEPVSLVLREATTNILRHANATVVRIDVTPRSIAIANDGLARGRGEPELSGLAVLRERLAQWHGTLEAGVQGAWFTTRAEFAPSTVG